MGFLRSLVVTTALAVSLVGLVPPSSARSGGDNLSPIVEGVCNNYTRHGDDLPCKIRLENNGEIVYLTDGYNVFTYVKGWFPNTYRLYVNDKEESMKLCTLHNYNFNCLTSIHFSSNEN